MKEQVLVTGGTGFLGLRIISELLKQDYKVRATLRSVAKQETVLETLTKNGIATENLSFVEADLSRDENWAEAMEDCTYVMSVASPVVMGSVSTEDEASINKQAVEGIQRILRIAEKSDVKRVVMTANFGAVGFSNKDKSSVTTEKDWTNPNEPGLSVYEKSKLIAEQAAWNFVDATDHDLELATINPVAILGPSLNQHMSLSFQFVENIANGKMKRIPNIPMNIVDVRDVATLHVLAMQIPEAAGKRFIATAEGQISMPEIAQLIKKERPEVADKVSTKKVPDFAIKLGAKFNSEAREGKLLLEMNRNVSNQQARNVLGWKPMFTQEEAILASVDSMKAYDILK
ncbi:SDR family NAD(P)-dependent oxidoreductase [Staphylococcus caledonicus]|uniref:SDR family NAD(P)-dependent oxidoreductase n=1 Tax=Staphylococcus sp. acrmy TaxID=2929076 RepID=UPI001F59D458|nr:SDR family NAD(P)-dependent oxidoreductase [Staphylococcus sp. acrmy]MCI2947112.1 SDR family NAD(P)-dependent oxidoreductase [Staphylococcus sp. acrmy]